MKVEAWARDAGIRRVLIVPAHESFLPARKDPELIAMGRYAWAMAEAGGDMEATLPTSGVMGHDLTGKCAVGAESHRGLAAVKSSPDGFITSLSPGQSGNAAEASVGLGDREPGQV